MRGRVLDENGDPADGAVGYLVGLPPGHGGAEVGIARAESADGRFQIGPVEPRVATAIVAPAQQLGTWSGGARRDGLRVDRDVDDVVLRLGTPVVFHVSARERDGTPSLSVEHWLPVPEAAGRMAA